MLIKQIDVPAGEQIDRAIEKAITQAVLEKVPIAFEFNGVTVHVNADSQYHLIKRDWCRGLRGYLGVNPTVGPHPAQELTEAEKVSDAAIKAEQEKRQAIAIDTYRAEANAKKALTEAKLLQCPPMTRDENKWQQYLESMKTIKGNGLPALLLRDEGYLNSIFSFAETWARLIEGEMACGKSLRDAADETIQEADIFGMTGFQHGVAVYVLAGCWAYGDDLRRWHNKLYGVDEDQKGTVNPALLTISVA